MNEFKFLVNGLIDVGPLNRKNYLGLYVSINTLMDYTILTHPSQKKWRVSLCNPTGQSLFFVYRCTIQPFNCSLFLFSVLFVVCFELTFWTFGIVLCSFNKNGVTTIACICALLIYMYRMLRPLFFKNNKFNVVGQAAAMACELLRILAYTSAQFTQKLVHLYGSIMYVPYIHVPYVATTFFQE